MAFCKQCGTDLADAKFCPNCGSSAEGELTTQQNTGVPAGADTRQRCLADMEHMLNYFGAKSAEYDEFEVVEAEVEDRSSRTYFGWIVAAVISVIIGLLSEDVIFYILAVPFIALFILQKKKNKEKLAEVSARLDALRTELDQYYDDYGYCAIGQEYTKPAILNILYDLVRKGRASTPGDAINIYLGDLRDEENRRNQEILVEQNKELAREMKKTRRYSAASFWLKK